jgi:hypothetical protein
MGPAAIYSWYVPPGYMRPLPRGDPPRPCEQEAIIEKEAEMEGPLATRLGSTMNRIRRLTDALLSSWELPEGSHAWSEVKKILGLSTDYSHSYRRKGGGQAT